MRLTCFRAGRGADACRLRTVADTPAEVTLLNVSYDPTREFYEEFNADFAASYKTEDGKTVKVNMSHGGSGKQARSVIDGLEADVVTLALQNDIDLIAKDTGKIPGRLAHQAAVQFRALHLDRGVPGAQGESEEHPRLGRPRPAGRVGGHAQSQDVRRGALELSGGLGLCEPPVRGRRGEDEGVRRRDLQERGETRQRRARRRRRPSPSRATGDVLITWENEAYLALEEFGADNYELIYPSVSIRAEPPVAVVEGNADKHGVRKMAEDYLKHLYSPAGQKIAARHYFRPNDQSQADPADIARFRQIEMVEHRRSAVRRMGGGAAQAFR